MILKQNHNNPVVLIVDDLSEVRRIIRYFLSQEDCEILEAKNGVEALRLFVEHQPDVILLDAMMPLMDGFEACRQIKAMPIAKTTPVLMVTSLNDKESIDRAFEAGATDYLTKPISSSILRQRVRHFLRSRQLEKHLARQNYILEQINRASQAATSSLDPQEILYQIIHVAGQAIDVTSAHVVQYNRTTKSVTPLASYYAPLVADNEQNCKHFVPSALDQVPHLNDWLVELPPPVYQFSVKDLTPQDQTYLCDVQSVLYVPFYVNGHLHGFLTFWESREERQFNSDEIALVQAIGGQIGSSLHNAQLHKSLKDKEENIRHHVQELESRNQELDSYTHTIAHDLKNPLQTLLSYINFVDDLDRNKLSEVGQTYMEKSQSHILHMSQMIDQLLMLASLRDATEAIEPIDVKAVVSAVLEQHQPELDKRGFKVSMAEELPKAMGNTTWLREVVANLVGNAIKYIGETNSEPQIQIDAKVLQGQIRYNVQDNGIGIAPEDQERIYQRFVRLHNPKVRGFGIGLAIVEQLVHKMNGQVGVESALGVGSVFWFTLPIPK